MASEWIKWVKGLTRRSEVVRMASGQVSALKADRRRVAVACMEFWEWADGETETGTINGMTEEFVDDLVALPGFYAAMVAVGWIEPRTDGSAILPNFVRHNGLSAKRRALDTERVRAKRSAGRIDTGEVSASEADNCPHRERTKSGPEERRGEERRGAAAPVLDSQNSFPPEPTGAERMEVQAGLVRLGIESGAAREVSLHPRLSLAMVYSAMESVRRDRKVRSRAAVLLTRLRRELEMIE